VFQKLAASNITSPELAVKAQIAYQAALEESLQFTQRIHAEGFLEALKQLKLESILSVISVFDAISQVDAKRLSKTEKNLDDFLKFKESHQSLALAAFLIIPIQRAPRYELLCRDLCKALTDDTEKQEFSTVLESLKTKNAQINANVSIPKINPHTHSLHRLSYSRSPFPVQAYTCLR